MIINKKSVAIVSLFLISLFLISFVYSADVVQVQQNPQTPEKESWFGKWFGFLKSPVFWGAFILVVIILLILFGLFLLIRWVIKFFKDRSDIYFKLKNDRIKLSKIQKSYSSKHFWKVSKNTPIRLVRKNLNGKPEISEPIAYHRGDYTAHEGNIIISLNLVGKKRFFLFPITDILVIPDREKIEIEQARTEKNKVHKEVINNLPRAKDIIQFNPNEILIYAESISSSGYFLFPVIRTKDNTIMDLALPVYQTLKEAVLNEYIYEQTNEFSILSKKGMNINPSIQAIIKTSEAGTNVDVPSDSKK